MRALVVVEHYDDVVDAVVTPKALGTGRIGQSDSAVIVPVTGCVTPAILMPKGRNREAGSRAQGAFRPIEDMAQGPATDRRRTITLAFEDAAAAAAKHTGPAMEARKNVTPRGSLT